MVKIKERIKTFVEGRAFAPFVALTAFLSHAFGAEIFAATVISVLTSFFLLVSDNAIPTLSPILFFTYLISRKHSPSYPAESDYLLSVPVLAALILCGALLMLSVIEFFVRNKYYKQISLRKAPELSGLLVYLFALIFSGILSGDIKNAGFAALESIALLLPFLVLYFGVPSEYSGEFKSALVYNALISVLLIFAELLLLYAEGGVIGDSGIIKEKIALGWGIWNNVGSSLVLPIPLLFLGAEGHPIPYLIGIVFALVGAVMTLSRNSILFGVIALFVSGSLLMLFGRQRRYFRRACILCLAILGVIFAVYFPEISRLLSDIFERGLSDNGRFALWREAIRGFFESPVIGNGFFAFRGEYHQFATAFPRLPHNTPLALLFGGGLFLFLSYGYYRLTTLRGIKKWHSVSHFLFVFSAMLLPLMSLLDNFFFNIYPTFLYTAALAAHYHEGHAQDP